MADKRSPKVKDEEPVAPPDDSPIEAEFRRRIGGSTPDGWYDILEQTLHQFRMVTDGVSWEMVDEERDKLKAIMEQERG